MALIAKNLMWCAKIHLVIQLTLKVSVPIYEVFEKRGFLAGTDYNLSQFACIHASMHIYFQFGSPKMIKLVFRKSDYLS